jgi:hypothetical protein
MKRQEKDLIYTKGIGFSKKNGMKYYHAPLFTEWGNLRDITLGEANGDSDHDFSGSNPFGAPPPGGSIPPGIKP